MINLPAISEAVLGTTLEGPWASDVVLTGPDGEQQSVRGQLSKIPEQVGQDSRGIAHGGRNSMYTNSYALVLRRSSLSPVPDDAGEWTATIPSVPGGTPDVTYFVETQPDGDKTFGMVTLRLTKTRQIDL